MSDNSLYEVRENCDVSTDDFWYDLTSGGYIIPNEILVNQEDIDEVENALAVLMRFKESCEAYIEDFER